MVYRVICSQMSVHNLYTTSHEKLTISHDVIGHVSYQMHLPKHKLSCFSIVDSSLAV